MSGTAATGVWVYAVCANVDERRLAGVAGVGGEPIRAVRAAGLTAVVGSVPLAEFGEEGLRRNLNDLARLESIARAHHRIVELSAGQGPVAPTRLATVYQDDARVSAMLSRRHDDMAAALQRVTGRQEWGVKVYGQSAERAPTASPPTVADAGSSGAGTAYLRGRRQQLAGREAARNAALNAAEGIHVDVSRHAVSARRHRPQDPQLTGDGRWMVLNGAYLVEDNASQAFAAVVASCTDRHTGVMIELTGPWPPYSFADVEVDRADQATGLVAGEPEQRLA